MVKAIDFYELVNLVSEIESDPARNAVIFGCDCGCGGEFYTEEEWEDLCVAASVAQETLEKFGVVFNE